jgi:hypothetical protein
VAGARPDAARLLEKLPLRFEPNTGQLDRRVQFHSSAPGYSLFLTGNEAVLSLASSRRTLRLSIVGAAAGKGEGLDPLRVRSSYFLGNDRSRWRSDVPSYARVRYANTLPGVDLIYHGNNRRLEYDFVVAPGADPRSIRMRFTGADRVSLDPDGTLVVKAGGSEIRQPKPLVYQESAGRRIVIDGRYVLRARSEVTFAVGSYDRARPLVIDPVLVYSSFLGGSGLDTASGVAIDAAGNIWIGGTTTSTDFPILGFPAQEIKSGLQDVFILKIDPNRTGTDSLVYATYYGGTQNEFLNDLTMDIVGNVYFTGYTDSIDLPVSGPIPQTASGGGRDIFVAKLETSGGRIPELNFSTYLGGADFDIGTGIAVDSSFRIAICGYTASIGYPVSSAPPQVSGQLGWEGVVTLIDTSIGGSGGLLFSTYYGGSSTDVPTAIAFDSAGRLLVTGYTFSQNFPLSDKPYKGDPPRGGDGFLVRLNPNKAGFDAIEYSTYFGGSGLDQPFRIAVEPGGAIWVAGVTMSADFPMAGPSAQRTNAGLGDAFAARFDLSLPRANQLTYSTFFGGSDTDVPYGLALDPSGRVYLSGYTASKDLPMRGSPLSGSFGGGSTDAFLAVIDPRAADGLLYSTYMGGAGSEVAYRVVVDPDGDITTVGYTQSKAFPVTGNGYWGALTGFSDAFVTKLRTCGDTLAPARSCN